MPLFPETPPDLNPEAPSPSCWPAWAEERRLDDSLAAAAYEATPPACRAAVKTGLALAHMHFGQHMDCRYAATRDAHLGFWRQAAACPAPWAVIAFTPAYAAAARLTAACVPALLAGVPLVGAVCVDGAPQNAALVSLELTGVEDIFLLDAAGLCALLQETRPCPGRLVLLHQGELDAAARSARVLSLPCFEERRPPTLALPLPEAFDLTALAFAQAEALDAALEGAQAFAPDAVYLAPEAARKHCREDMSPCDSMPALTPGCEGFWLHPGLTPDFFRVRRLAFGPL